MSLFSQFVVVAQVQSGVTVAAGTVSITAVDVTRAMVISVSKGSAGTVAATGSISLSPAGGLTSGGAGGTSAYNPGSFPTYSGSITGGTTDLTVKQYSARLTSSTTLSVDGPVEWQVVQF